MDNNNYYTIEDNDLGGSLFTYLERKYVKKDHTDNSTQGRVLKRMSSTTIYQTLGQKLAEAGFKKTRSLQFDTQYSEFNVVHNLDIYTSPTGDSIIIFSAITDSEENLNSPPLPTCTEVLKYIKENSAFKEAIKELIKNAMIKKPPKQSTKKLTNDDDWNIIPPPVPIRIYIPIATTYIDLLGIKHQHFRGLYLDVTLDNNDLFVIEASLIDSRGKYSYSGYTCPYIEIETNLKIIFPKCVFQKIFTGHQQESKWDNDSCGYRVASYGVQIAIGADPNKLADDVKCSTKLIEFIYKPFATNSSKPTYCPYSTTTLPLPKTISPSNKTKPSETKSEKTPPDTEPINNIDGFEIIDKYDDK